jgi:Ca2+-binding RTX toxin-like protein
MDDEMIAARLFGQGGNDRLYPGAGDDRFEGQGGNDCLIGGVGSDLVNGGTGADSSDDDDVDAVLEVESLLA